MKASSGPVRGSSHSFLGKAGAFLGDTATKLIGKITGLGDYKIESNSLVGGMVPSFGGEMSTTFSRREFLADVKSSVDFAVTAYPINPGLGTVFPWGSRVAANFEQYRLRGMLFEFKTTCGSAIASTNNALGVVIMSTQYDPLEPPFQDKREMEAYVYTSSSVPSQSQVHAVECKPSLTAINAQYLRSNAIPQDADLRMYDHGTFYIATAGMQAADITIGELWVTYHVELIKPRLLSPLQSLDQASSWTMASSHAVMAASTPTLYQYTDPNFVNVTVDTPFARVTFAPHIVGLFKVTTYTYSSSSLAADNITHQGWRTTGGTGDFYLGFTFPGSIRWWTQSEMEGMYGGNWGAFMTAPKDSSSLFDANRTITYAAGAPTSLVVETTQLVVVDNKAGGTCSVRTPTLSTALNCHTLVVVNRVGPAGLESKSGARRPLITGSMFKDRKESEDGVVVCAPSPTPPGTPAPKGWFR